MESYRNGGGMYALLQKAWQLHTYLPPLLMLVETGISGNIRVSPLTFLCMNEGKGLYLQAACFKGDTNISASGSGPTWDLLATCH